MINGTERKYKILFADDEYWTREKMRMMIEWERYSLEFLEPAKNGEEVLERLQNEKVDILITDINMPFLNGVDLLEQIQEKYPELVTFVISGYDDFTYVKGTFRSGAINYMLKPISKIDLVNALVDALNVISSRENEKIRFLKAASLIQDREFSQLIKKDDDSYIPSIAINSGADFAQMSLVLVKIHNLHELVEENQHDMNLLSYNVKKVLHRLTGDEKAIVFNHIYRSNEFIIISETRERELIKAAEKIRIHFSKYSDICLTFCISMSSYSMENIHMAYVEAVSLLMTRQFRKKDEILFAKKEDTYREKNVEIHFSAELEKHLRNYLQMGNVDVLKRIALEESGISGCKEKGWSYIEVRQTIKQIMNVFADYASRNCGNKELIDIENLMESADKAIESLDGESVCTAITDMIEYLKPEEKETPTDTMKGIVKKAAAYVDEYYFENLTLVALAEMYHVESSYFSKMFRQEIGENLILYITKRRIEKSKEYMKDKNINLTEIAFMVGYDDYTYFSRVFKKNTGISPREYRAGIMGKEE